MRHTTPLQRCVFCHDDIETLLTEAHHHGKRERLANRGRAGIDASYPLCWSCHHGLLHAGIISIEEVQEAAAATVSGIRKVTHDEVYRLLKADLEAGQRQVKWNFDDRSPEERSDAARRAQLSRTDDERSAAARRAWQHPSRRRARRPIGDTEML